MAKVVNVLKLVMAKIEWFFTKVNDLFLNFFRKHYLWIVLIVLIIASFIVRIAFLPFLSGDMYWFLQPWFNHLRNNGGLKAMGTYPWTGMDILRAGDYPPAYITFLALLSYIPGEPINIIKLFSIFFDYVLAFGALLIIREFTKNKFYLLISAAVLLFFPTSILNGAVWGQADQIYTACVVWMMYFLIKDKPKIAMIPLGLGLAMKLQTIFVVPLLIFMWLARRFKLRHLLIIPLVIFITFIPSYIMGAPFAMPFNMYNNQINSLYRNANYNSGSLYAFFDMWHYRDGINDKAGVVFAIIIVGIILLYLYHYKVPATKKNLIYVGTLFSIAFPYVLPHMHERYFFMADVMLIIYVLIYKRKYLLAVLMNFSSIITYVPFLTGQPLFRFLGTDGIRLAALINFAIIYVLIKDAPKVLEKESDLTLQTIEKDEEIVTSDEEVIN